MSIESIRVSNFMTRNVKTETEDQNIQAVCKTMNENNIGSVIITPPFHDNNQKPVGIITERDVVRIIGQLNPSLLHVPIKELMSKPLITLWPNSSIRLTCNWVNKSNRLATSGGLQACTARHGIYKCVIPANRNAF